MPIVKFTTEIEQTLAVFMREHGAHAAAAHYGVSVASINNWCKKLHIPRRGKTEVRRPDAQTMQTLVDTKTIAEIAEHLGVADRLVLKWCRVLHVATRRGDEQHEKRIKQTYLNKQFGKLRVVSVSKNNGEYLLNCVCTCGNECSKTIAAMAQSCKRKNYSCGCSKFDHTDAMYQYVAGKDNYLWRGHGDISAKFWASIRANANTRNINFNITIEDAWQIYEKQNGLCTLSNEPINFVYATESNTETTASLDRIFPQLGYTAQNVWWVHKQINEMKWDLSLDYFILLCSLIVVPYQNETVHNEATLKVHHLNWQGYGNVSKDYFTQVRKNAELRSIDFDLTIEDLWDKFVYQRGYCALSGLPLQLKMLKMSTSASIDRIDGAKAYTPENVQWVHRDINVCLRKSMPLTDLYAWCTKVVEHNAGATQGTNTRTK